MKSDRFRIRVGGLVEAAAAAAALGTLFAFGGRWWWILELLTHFRPHYLLGLIVGAVYCAAVKRWRLAAVFGACAVFDLALIVPLYVPVRTDGAGGPSIRLLLANVHVHNRDHDRFLQLVREQSPDVVVVLEVNGEWLDALDTLSAEYPHRISRPRSDSFGIAFFSRLPTRRLEIREIGPAEVPSIVAQVDCGENTLLHLVATHPLPPVSAENSRLRNDQIRDVGQLVGGMPRPTVLVGDLNATSWSPFFRDLIAASGLRDSRLGFSVQPTWPGQLAFVGVAIDHVLISPEISVVHRAVGPDIGSDHRPVIIDLRLPLISGKNGKSDGK